MLDRHGSLFVVTAPSGSGKTTLVKQLLASLDGIQFSVSFTTRARRGDEEQGVDYHFITENVFHRKIEENELLEWAEVHGNMYGTSCVETEKLLRAGKDLLLDIDVQGAAEVRRAMPDAVTVFIMPPSYEELEERLRGRKQDTLEVIESRLAKAQEEVFQCQSFDYVVVNDSLQQASNLLQAIVLAERSRPRLLVDRIKPILESFESNDLKDS